jgi:ribosomal protein S18 acetylase RimI-like enzyme
MSAGIADRIALRPEREEDLPFRYRLFCESRPQLALLPLDAEARERLTSMQFRAQTVGYQTQFPGARHDIIELDAEPVGRLVSDRSARMLRLVDIAVLAAARRRGIGRAALALLMDEAAGAGLAMRLQVDAGNPDAFRLYARLGFRTVERTDIHAEMEWTASPAAAEPRT